MNDEQYVEASRRFARRIMTEGGATPEERATFAFRVSTSRKPKADEIAVLMNVFTKQLDEFRANREGAEKLLKVGDMPPDSSLDAAELAAWTMVANVLLNLDETVTKG
jgi:hypothetical protein